VVFFEKRGEEGALSGFPAEKDFQPESKKNPDRWSGFFTQLGGAKVSYFPDE
jgi:hypothetical protein